MPSEKDVDAVGGPPLAGGCEVKKLLCVIDRLQSARGNTEKAEYVFDRVPLYDSRVAERETHDARCENVVLWLPAFILGTAVDTKLPEAEKTFLLCGTVSRLSGF